MTDEKEAGWGRGESVVKKAVREEVAQVGGGMGGEGDGAAAEAEDAVG